MSSLIITLVIVAALCLVAYASQLYLGANNPVEQECETLIQSEIGQKVNLDISKPSAPQQTTPQQTNTDAQNKS